MQNSHPITFSDLIVLGLTFYFICIPENWSNWGFLFLLLWFRFHMIRKRLWNDMKQTVANGKAYRKMMAEKREKQQ